ncbi:MAG TPA: hypothetical protein VNU45_09780 [Rummeliibacillus sp.]|nr:hypothetical protein [Rummeliibacillus sp.]
MELKDLPKVVENLSDEESRKFLNYLSLYLSYDNGEGFITTKGILNGFENALQYVEKHKKD